MYSLLPVVLILSGEDGPSQMGLEDLCMFRAVPNSTVFYPSDAVATEKAVEIAANTKVCATLFLKRSVYKMRRFCFLLPVHLLPVCLHSFKRLQGIAIVGKCSSSREV